MSGSSWSQWFGGANKAPPNDEEALEAEKRALEEKQRLRASHLRETRIDEPLAVRIVRTRLVARRQQSLLRNALYVGALQLTPEQMRTGEVANEIVVPLELRCGQSLLEYWRKRQHRAYALSAQLVGCNTQTVPFATVLHIDLGAEHHQQGAVPIVAHSGAMWSVPQARGEEASGPLPLEMLRGPISVHEPTYGRTFSSIEAIGFKEAALQRVCSTTASGHISIPLDYRYAGLIAHVHAVRLLYEHRATLDALSVHSMSPSVYALQASESHLLIEPDALAKCVAYISKHLVHANQEFDIERVQVRLSTFGAQPWLAAWSDAYMRRDNVRAVAPQRSDTVKRSAAVGSNDNDAVSERDGDNRPLDVAIAVRLYFVCLPLPDAVPLLKTAEARAFSLVPGMDRIDENADADADDDDEEVGDTDDYDESATMSSAMADDDVSEDNTVVDTLSRGGTSLRRVMASANTAKAAAALAANGATATATGATASTTTTFIPQSLG